MKKIPRDKNLDSTLPLFLKGYPFLHKRFHKHKTDIYKTRFMGKKAICLHGEEGAALFFSEEYMKRHGAIPKKIQNTLMGRDSIHMQDDAEHKHRKQMFMQLMTEEKMRHLSYLMSQEWQEFIDKWKHMNQVVLMDEVKELLTRAMCNWSGVPLKESEVKKRTRDFWKMIDAFGAGVGTRHIKGRRARNRAEKWMISLIRQVRSGELKPPKDTSMYVISMHRGLDGKLMDERITAVEILNGIRPTVAICTYIAFIGLALHRYPQYRYKLLHDDGTLAENFVHEIRRYYPFVPILGALTRKDFEWRGYKIKKGRMAIIDVYGTLHDERLWERASVFFPERFSEWKESPHDLIPQGGGYHNAGHRCPGEWVTIETMKVALDYLVKHMTYDVPEQDLDYDLQRMPSYPKSKFIIKNVARTDAQFKASKLTRCPFHFK